MEQKDQRPVNADTTFDGMIGLLKATCRSWVEIDSNGEVLLIDPHEHRSITTHYGNTHLAAALLIDSHPGDADFELGLGLLDAVLRGWIEDASQPDFHHDFNNFALCLIARRLADFGSFADRIGAIRDTVLNTADSRHMTVNWLPMRILANLDRGMWTGRATYRARAKAFDQVIRAATGADGFIEDRLPRGKSFSLQYDVATVAGLELLRREGWDRDLDQLLEPLVNACDPLGDINYLGRGCNQVFAWGPWLYLLKARAQHSTLSASTAYLASRLGEMVRNGNLLLNPFRGADRDYWWDYHYCSVYTAHLLLWLVLAKQLPADCARGQIVPATRYGGQTGLSVWRSDNAFVAVFSGRSEYSAESGPVIANIWTDARGTIAKGTFGPWAVPFGTKYASALAPHNHFGLMQLVGARVCSARPLLVPISVHLDPHALMLQFLAPSAAAAVMSMPAWSAACVEGVSVTAGDVEVRTHLTGSMRSQYGDVALVQSQPARARCWRVIIPL